MAAFKKRGKHAKGNTTPVTPAAPSTETEQIAPNAGAAPTEVIAPVETQSTAAPTEAIAPIEAQDTEAIAPNTEPETQASEDGFAGFDTPVSGYPPNTELATEGAFVAADYTAIPKKRNRGGLKVFGITIGIIFGIVLVAYIAGVVVFMGRFLPNTFIGENDISMKSNDEVVKMLDSIAKDYQLDVVGEGFSYRTTGADIGMSVDSNSIIQSIHQDQQAFAWPVLIFQPSHDETSKLWVSYKPQNYEQDVTDRIKQYNETAPAPVNATIVYNEKTSSFDVKPEEAGKQLDTQAVLSSMGNAITTLEPKLVLSSKELVQPTVLSTDEKLIESAKLATGMVSAHVDLKMNGKVVSQIDGEDLSRFVTVNDKLDVTFDEDALYEWLEEFTREFNTIDSERTFTRPDGKEITVSGGSYGWEVDTESLANSILEAIKSGSKTEIDIPCTEEAAVYNGPGKRDWGNRYLDVDLGEQHVRFYDADNNIIWESDCISGSPDGEHDTGLGVWYINNKESPSKLVGYEHGKKIYETMVTYWMAFEGNGIGFHDATWQPGFGGSMYAEGYGSHGCVNLPYSAAEELYGLCEVGDPVVVHW